VASLGEVVPGHPPLRGAVLPARRDGRGGDHRLVRHPVHRAYPREMFDFVEGVIRWDNRVIAYAVVLVTDLYPPFRLSP
jgi:hypothetical protein